MGFLRVLDVGIPISWCGNGMDLTNNGLGDRLTGVSFWLTGQRKVRRLPTNPALAEGFLNNRDG
jgi:hypothetical protein